jgi:DNA-binding NarL/FixJ family response regulator
MPTAMARRASVAETDRIGVLIVDDHRLFADGLARLLGDDAGIEVLGVAATAAEALAVAARVRPQVVLVDYQLPDRDGVEVTLELKRADPETMVLMLTGTAEERVLLRAIDAGCSGFLTKDRAVDEVTDAVRAAAAGEALISPSLLVRLLPRLARSTQRLGDDLTARELDVLRLLAAGCTNQAVADELHISVNTVRNHVQAVLTKLHAHSKLEAVAAAVRAGVIDYPGSR